MNIKLKQDTDILFGLMGDSHITFEGAGVREVKKALEIYSQIGVEALVFTGDIIYQADNWNGPTTKVIKQPYEYYNKLINDCAKNVPIVYCMGNHEYAQNNEASEALLKDAVSLFEEQTSQKVKFHTVIKGFHFITAEINDFCCRVTRDTEEWVENEIEKALSDDEEKPVFVIMHAPIQETVIDSPKKENAKYSDEFKKFLNQRNRIVFLCGHLHTAAQNPRSIWQDGFTVVHSPNTAVGALGNDGINNEESVCGISQGLIVAVKDNYVKIYKLDFNTDELIGEPWEIDINAGRSGFLYTDKRFKNTNKPYFDNNAELNVKINGGGKACVCFSRALCEPYGKNQDGFAAAYNIKVTDKQSGEIVSDLWYQADYYYTVPHGDFLEKNIAGLEYGRRYVFEIYAVNPLGSVSEKPLKKELFIGR